MEDDLAAMNVEQLRRRVRSLEAQLNDAVALVESARLGREEFVSDLGHEVRTPMNAVIGFCDLLFSTRLDPVSKGYVESIRAAGIKLLDIFRERSEEAREEGEPRSGPAESCFIPRSKVFPLEGTEEGSKPGDLDEPRLGKRGRAALRTVVDGAREQMGGVVRFSVVRALVVEIELMQLDPEAAPEVASFARALRVAADSRDVVVLERLLLSVVEDPE